MYKLFEALPCIRAELAQKWVIHTIGFRQSEQYQDWKKLLHHFYELFPTVEHYELSFAAQHGIREGCA